MIEWSEDVMARLRERYGLVTQQHPQTPAGESLNNVSHVSHVSQDGGEGGERAGNMSQAGGNVSQNVSQAETLSPAGGAPDAADATRATRATGSTGCVEDTVDPWDGMEVDV